MAIQSIRFGAATASITSAAERIDAASRALSDLREHPGVARGRAGDGGDDVLRDAVLGFTTAWDVGLEQLASETRRWADLLRSTAAIYDELERQALAQAPTGRGSS